MTHIKFRREHADEMHRPDAGRERQGGARKEKATTTAFGPVQASRQ
jgi:hypothetical protein